MLNPPQYSVDPFLSNIHFRFGQKDVFHNFGMRDVVTFRAQVVILGQAGFDLEDDLVLFQGKLFADEEYPFLWPLTTTAVHHEAV